MRTTIRLPDDLLRQAKTRAATEGRTLNAVIEQAVRVWLQPALARVERPPIPVSTRLGGLLPGINLDKTSELLDMLDAEDGKWR